MAVGRMAYDAGLFRQASQHFRKALELAESENLPEELVSLTLLKLAKTLGSIGAFDEGESLLRRALHMAEQLSTADPDFVTELIEDYHQLSLLYWRAGKAEEAKKPLEQAFDLLKEQPLVPDELIAKMLKHKAVLCDVSGDYRQCEILINEAIAFIQNSHVLGKHSLIYGDCLMVKVMLLTELDRFDEATELYREGKQLLDVSRGNAHPKMQELFEALSELASRKGLPAAAGALKKQADDVKVNIKNRDKMQLGL